ncbi:MAG: diguanylate cyclase [Spirochaetales bacterium]|nr:diguanylate cyclase [Spirochaetales bacterium]
MRGAVFLGVLIGLTTLFPCYGRGHHSEELVRVEEGILDLRGLPFDYERRIPLEGEWGFYWNRLASPRTASSFVSDRAPEFLKVPGYWNEGEYPSFGTVVYTLTIYVPEESDTLGLKLKNLNPNYMLFVNGRKVYTSGMVHPEQRMSRSNSVSLVLPLVPEEGRIDLVITQSNWHTNNPGLFRTPIVGYYPVVLEDLMREKAIDTLFIGGMILLSLFLYFSFFYNRDDWTPFWLGSVVISAALYASVKGPLVLMDLLPKAGGSLRTGIIYGVLLYYPFFTFMQYTYRKGQELFKLIGKIDAVIIGLGTLFLVLADKGVYTRFELLFLSHAILLSFFVIFTLFLDLIRQKTIEAALDLTGEVLLFLAVLFSVLDNFIPNGIRSLGGYFFCFCLFQTFLQARYTGKTNLMIKVLAERNRTLKDQKDQYENQALMDHLTRVKNRRSLDSFLRKSWEMGQLLGQGIGIIMVDIDYFKKYNDAFGHKKGDACLVQVAEALSGSLKRNQDFIARYGGEEFIIVIQGADSLASLQIIAEHLRQAVEDENLPHPQSECSPFVTISVGAEFQNPARGNVAGPDELVHRADMALYLAKNRGRNRVESVSAPEKEEQAEVLEFDDQ